MFRILTTFIETWVPVVYFPRPEWYTLKSLGAYLMLRSAVRRIIIEEKTLKSETVKKGSLYPRVEKIYCITALLFDKIRH